MNEFAINLTVYLLSFSSVLCNSVTLHYKKKTKKIAEIFNRGQDQMSSRSSGGRNIGYLYLFALKVRCRVMKHRAILMKYDCSHHEVFRP
jgi:hypothetical protein